MYGVGMGDEPLSRIADCSYSRFNWLTNAKCWPYPLSQWQTWNASTYTKTAGVPADLRSPPSDGTEAEATIAALVNQQMVRQQAANAAGVQPVNDFGWHYLPDVSAWGLPSFGDMNWWLWIGLGGAALFAMVTMTAGGPRRYGR